MQSLDSLFQCLYQQYNVGGFYYMDEISQIQEQNKVRKMRKFLSKFDLFPASPILRANGESEVVNLCGSIFSICLFTYFTYLFIDSMVKTIQLEQITATQITKIETNSERRISNITVAIGLQFYQLTNLRNIFQTRSFLINERLQPTQLTTFPCTRQMWANFTDEQYANLRLEYAMCAQRQGIQIFGDFGGTVSNVLQVSLHSCTNETSPVTCATPAEINGFFATHMFLSRFLIASAIILDTGLNPTNQNPYTYRAYEKTLWILFNQHQYIMGQVFFGAYQINTDKSFLPFQQTTTEVGHYVTEAITVTLVNYLNLPVFFELLLVPSRTSKIINRSYGKFDQVLSYVGGLYGIVIGFIGICLLSFNQYKYELRVSQGAFTFMDGYLAREQDLHFGKYLKYVAFDWIKTFLCIQPNWKDCKAIDEARQEANQQIDVKHLLKRISHLEKVQSTMMSEKDEAVIFMAESNSLEEARHRRGIVQYCEKFTDQTKSMTIRTFDNLSAVIQLGLGIQMKSISVVPLNQSNDFVNEIKERQFSEEEKEQKDSFVVMDSYLKRYIENFKITENNFQLNQDDLEIQKNLTEAFYGVQQSSRMKLLKKIPLGILYRLRECKRNMMNKNSNSNSLESLQNITQNFQRNNQSSNKYVNNRILKQYKE